jgi:hypothetical protein
MDKATGTIPKLDESEAMASQLDKIVNATGIDRDELRELFDIKYIEQSLDSLRLAEKLMRYKGSNHCHKKNACRK